MPLRRKRSSSQPEAKDSVLAECLVDIAVEPTFPLLCGGNDGGPAVLRMLRRVSVRRRITTTRDPASLTGSQVHPLRPHLYTLFTLARFRLLDRRDRREMIARRLCHGLTPILRTV